MDKRVFLCGLSERNEKLFWEVWNKFPDDDKEIIEARYIVLDVYEERNLVHNGKLLAGSCSWNTFEERLHDQCRITLNVDDLSDDDAKFTIAHELGHAIMHNSRDDSISEDEVEREELEADTIAESVLYPELIEEIVNGYFN